MRLLDPASLVRSVADADPRRLALVTPDARLSYGELALRIDATSAAWTGQGAGPGLLVRLPVPATTDGIVGLLAVHACGAIPLPTVAARPSIEEAGFEATIAVATSGSTGAPRIVPLTAENLAASVAASRARLCNDEDDRWLLCLPLHHVGGLSVLWRSFAAGGAVVALDAFDARTAAEALRGEATVASFVPTMVHRLLSLGGGPFASVRFALLGGGPGDTGLVESALDAGLPLLTTYGMTETASQAATVAPGEIGEALGTAGRPLDGIELSFEDGEILVDGPQVYAGYAGAPPRMGPHRTGDLGRLDGNGRLVVLGRKDEVVISGGENIHPARVEAVLEAHPAVTAAVAFGVPDPEWGGRLEAVVESGADAADLQSWARGRLQAHEIPKRIVVVDRLPRLPSGKPDRVESRRLVEQ